MTVIFSVNMFLGSVGVAVTSEDQETEEIRCESCAAYDEDELWVLDFGRVNKPREGFEHDGNA